MTEPPLTPAMRAERLAETWGDAPGIWGFLTTVDHKRIAARYILTIVVLVTGLRLWLRRAALPTRARVGELLRAGEPADAPAAA